jgi:hypothetical protein
MTKSSLGISMVVVVVSIVVMAVPPLDGRTSQLRSRNRRYGRIGESFWRGESDGDPSASRAIWRG